MSALRLLALWFLGVPLLLAGGAEPTLKELFGPGYLHQVRLSPDGRRLAAVASWNSQSRGLITIDIETGRTRNLRGNESLDVGAVSWHGSELLTFSVIRDHRYSWGLYATPADNLGAHMDIRHFDVINVLGTPLERPDRLWLWSRASADRMGRPGPIQEIELALDQAPSRRSFASRVRQTVELPQKTQVVNVIGAPDGELGFSGFLNDGGIEQAYWDLAARTWRPFPHGNDQLKLRGMDFDRAYAWVATLDEEGSHLRRLRLADGHLETPVLSDARYSLSQAFPVFARSSRELVGVRHVRQGAVTTWLVPRFAEIQRQVNALLPTDEVHRLQEWDDAERRFLVHSQGSRQPGLYHLFDATTGDLSRIGAARPELDVSGLPATRAVNFTARDGLRMEAFVTLPRGASTERPAPLVVLPHGGPWVRDTSAYDPEVHFLVSRGYAVLRPNYRGSTGYVLIERGDYEADFAGMRDDVIDATRSALRSGLFDPRRVAIMGSSFGGYLALACPVEEPELYRAAVSFAGVFDWQEHIKFHRGSNPDFSIRHDYLRNLLGDQLQTQEGFEALSPLRRVERVRIPFFLAHGRADTVVSAKQTRALAREFRVRGVPHETFYREFASHGLFSAADRLAYYAAVERFLDNPPRSRHRREVRGPPARAAPPPFARLRG